MRITLISDGVHHMIPQNEEESMALARILVCHRNFRIETKNIDDKEVVVCTAVTGSGLNELIIKAEKDPRVTFVQTDHDGCLGEGHEFLERSDGEGLFCHKCGCLVHFDPVFPDDYEEHEKRCECKEPTPDYSDMCCVAKLGVFRDLATHCSKCDGMIVMKFEALPKNIQGMVKEDIERHPTTEVFRYAAPNPDFYSKSEWEGPE